MRKALAIGAVCLALAGCANMNDPTTVIVSAESTYGAYMAAENAYLASGKTDPAVVQALANARRGVASVLDPLASSAAAGTAPTSDQVLAAQTALASFQAVLQANGLLKAQTSTGSK